MKINFCGKKINFDSMFKFKYLLPMHVIKRKIIRNRKINHKFTMLRPATVLPNSAESTYIYVYIYIYIYICI